MATIDQAFADWYADRSDDRDNYWDDESGTVEEFDFSTEELVEVDAGIFDAAQLPESTIAAILAGTLVSDDAVDIDVWLSLRGETNCE